MLRVPERTRLWVKGQLNMERQKAKVEFDRVKEKVDEARFFLQRMVEHRKRWPAFGYYFSAFLSAFQSIFYRLKCTGDSRKLNQQIKTQVKQFCESIQAIADLSAARDAEVHGEGVKVVMSFEAPCRSASPWRESPWQGLWHGPWENPWKGAWETAPRERSRVVWKFGSHYQHDLVKLCRASLDEAQSLLTKLAAAHGKKDG